MDQEDNGQLNRYEGSCSERYEVLSALLTAPSFGLMGHKYRH